jgi:hypothetical protein
VPLGIRWITAITLAICNPAGHAKTALHGRVPVGAILSAALGRVVAQRAGGDLHVLDGLAVMTFRGP